MIRRAVRLALLVTLVTNARVVAQTTSQERTAPSLKVDVTAGYRPILRFGDLLNDRELSDAVHSGLPVRLRVRVELWRDRMIDALEQAQSWSAVLLYDPLDREYTVRTRGNPGTERTFTALDPARRALEGPPTVILRPRRTGSYYYTATIEVETLSLSDLQELERWLQGELQPAVSGDRSVPGAVGEGAKRLLIRVLGLPARTVDLKTPGFRFPE